MASLLGNAGRKSEKSFGFVPRRQDPDTVVVSTGPQHFEADGIKRKPLSVMTLYRTDQVVSGCATSKERFT